jgi:hypothetical protein
MDIYNVVRIAFICAVHVLTIGTSAWTAWKIFHNPVTAIFGSITYTLIPYRFYISEISRDYGELMAWAVFPIVGYVVWLLYDSDRPVYKKLVTGAGYFAVNMILTNCVWWLTGIKSILSGTFTMADGFSIQAHGVYLIHYLMAFFRMNGTSDEFMENGMVDSAPLGIGFIITVGVFVYLWLRITHKAGENHAVFDFLMILGLAAAYLSSNICPWDIMQFSIRGYRLVYLLIKVPSRFMGTAALSFWLVGCRAFDRICSLCKNRHFTGQEEPECI